MERTFSHTVIGTLYREYGVEARDPGGKHNILRRSTDLIAAVLDNPDQRAAEANLREIIDRSVRTDHLRQLANGLMTSLAADGYEWGDGRLVPAMPAPAPVAGEVTALEAELQARNFTVAGNHYRQAVDNFADGNFEACNGQLRSFLEGTIKEAARLAGQTQDAGPDACLQYLRRDAQVLNDDEWNLFRALWAGVQNNGAHAGLTNEEEARFRMHTATAAGRYLLKKTQ